MATNKDFRPLVPACTERGIGKTTAFDLVKRGLLDTVTIGRKRYVYVASLDALPEKLKAEAKAAA
jgi:hypothetical protein